MGIKSAEPKKGGDGMDGDSRAGHGQSKIDGSEMDNVEVDGGEVEVKIDEIGKKVRKLFKSKNLPKSKKMIRSLDFFILGAKLVFTKLRQAFLKALIFHYFDPECYIWIKTDASGYATGGVLSQLTLDDSR